MTYGETKVYHDGSHYIAIPHTTRPKQKKSKKFNFTEKFDLIFIDGAKSQYINFFEKYKENLAPDGVFISDNLSFHGMVEDINITKNYSTIKLIRKIRRYIDFLKANKEFDTTFYSIGDGVAISKRAEIK